MAYCTQSDLLNQLTNAELVQLADDAHTVFVGRPFRVGKKGVARSAALEGFQGNPTPGSPEYVLTTQVK